MGAKAQDGGALSKLTISMRSETKARLEAMSTLTQQPVWRVVDDALSRAFEQLSPKDRHAVDTMANRIRDRASERVMRLPEHTAAKRRPKT